MPEYTSLLAMSYDLLTSYINFTTYTRNHAFIDWLNRMSKHVEFNAYSNLITKQVWIAWRWKQ